MLKVGLTGSIAVGKTFVCEILRELGAYVLDADQVAREVVEPETSGWKLIVENFGPEVLQSDKTLNRAKMAAIVFSDEAKRNLLNSILHPLIFEVQNEWLSVIESADPRNVAIIDAALMIETGGYRRFDKIVVVWCQPEIQLERLMTRNGLDRQEALRRINSQMSQEQKKKFADYLIDTSEGFDSTRRQTVELFGYLKQLA